MRGTREGACCAAGVAGGTRLGLGMAPTRLGLGMAPTHTALVRRILAQLGRERASGKLCDGEERLERGKREGGSSKDGDDAWLEWRSVRAIGALVTEQSSPAGRVVKPCPLSRY